jgi:hypothetical protein
MYVCVSPSRLLLANKAVAGLAQQAEEKAKASPLLPCLSLAFALASAVLGGRVTYRQANGIRIVY